MIAANEVGAGKGFEVEDNALHVIWDGGSRRLARTRKDRLARQLLAVVATRYQGKNNRESVIDLHAKNPA
jgi:phosphopantothenoylcysteine decarboxylase/phosphopantothenate--cysteine ligase